MSISESLALPRPSLGDKRRVVRAAISGLVRVLVRRRLGRPLIAKWPMSLELLIAATRGSWLVMPSIGAVRWRNVGEAVSPLRTDGLPPRFVNVSPDGAASPFGAWREPPDAGCFVCDLRRAAVGAVSCRSRRRRSK